MPSRIVPSREILKGLYDSGLSAREVAEHFGLNPHTVASALRRYGISTRTTRETKALQKKRGVIHAPTRYWLGKKQPPEMVERRVSKIRGENHYLWKGGNSLRPYRDKITKVQCSDCGSKLNLGIHHVDLDHYNNDPENLQVLCTSCHMRLHKQAYWDAIHAGKEPPRSNGPIGWRRNEEEVVPNGDAGKCERVEDSIS